MRIGDSSLLHTCGYGLVGDTVLTLVCLGPVSHGSLLYVSGSQLVYRGSGTLAADIGMQGASAGF
jgi:hypothetical protein